MKYRWRVSNHTYGVVSDPEHELPGSGKTTQCREERRFLLSFWWLLGRGGPQITTRHCLATAKIFCSCGALEVLWEPSRSSSSGFHGDLWELLSTSLGGQQPVQVFFCLSPCPRDLPTHISHSFAQTEQNIFRFWLYLTKQAWFWPYLARHPGQTKTTCVKMAGAYTWKGCG